MELLEETAEEGPVPEMVRTVIGVSAVASTGYVLLNSRIAYWLLSILGSRPLWKGFDPLEVIYAWEEEQEEETGQLRQPHFWSRRRRRDDESLASLAAGRRTELRQIEEAER
jgi:hypothetical protein